MKKTLITLAALAAASVASAADSQIITGDILWGGDTYAAPYKVSFTLPNVSSISDGSILFGYWSGGPTGEYGANAFVFTMNGNELQLMAGTGHLSQYADLSSATFTVDGGRSVVLDYDFSDAQSTTVFTLEVTAGSPSGYQSVKLWADSEVVATAASSYNGNMSGKYNTDINARFNDKIAVYTDTPAIPEPATATLSLLALAGLAARRRRK